MADPVDPAREIDRQIDLFDGGELAELTGHSLLSHLRRKGWSLVRIADSWAADNGGHCILADEVWRP